jgi:hypothetical protein
VRDGSRGGLVVRGYTVVGNVQCFAENGYCGGHGRNIVLKNKEKKGRREASTEKDKDSKEIGAGLSRRR